MMEEALQALDYNQQMADRGDNFNLAQIRRVQFQRLQVEEASSRSNPKASSCKTNCLRIMSALHILMMLASIAIFIAFVMLDQEERLEPFTLLCVGAKAASKELCVIAIGQYAYGIIAIGQFGIGLVSISQLGVGLFFCFSQLGVSLFCALGQIVTAPLIPICQHGIAGVRMKLAVLGVQVYPFFFKDEEGVVASKCVKRRLSK